MARWASHPLLQHLGTSQQLTAREPWYVAISKVRLDLRILTDSAQRLPVRVERSTTQAMALKECETEGGEIPFSSKTRTWVQIPKGLLDAVQQMLELAVDLVVA